MSGMLQPMGLQKVEHNLAEPSNNNTVSLKKTKAIFKSYLIFIEPPGKISSEGYRRDC